MSLTRQIYPQINRSLIDLVSTGKTKFFLFSEPSFLSLIILLLLINILVSGLNRFSVYASSILGTKLEHYLREIGFRHLLKLSVGYYNHHQSGNIMSKLNRGVNGIRNIVSNLGIHFFPSILTGIFSIITVASINWKVSLVTVFVFIPYFFLKRQHFNEVSKIEDQQDRVMDREYGHFWEVLGNIRLVKTFAAESFELKKFSQTVSKLIKGSYRIELGNNKSTISDIFVDIWMLGVYGYIFYLGLQKQITVGTVILLTQYIEMIRQPLWNLSWIFWVVKHTQVSVRGFLRILQAKPDLTEIQNPTNLLSPQGKVEFDNVWFKYPEKSGQEVLRGVSFTVQPGKTLALVGKSGVGKTTIAHLIIRFFDPDKGRVLLDGIDLRDLSFPSLRAATGLVMQESYLYDDTIASNLRYGKPNATTEELIIACRVANAMEFIEKLPRGLETEIGERGIKLSGGQNQRLSLARTVLKNPKVLVLDEATSALDSHSELLVQDALWKLIKGRTTIIIAHRLSTIQKADEIIVLDKKKIAEQGTHESLLKLNGIYSSLHKVQSGQISTLKQWDLIA